ncbi:MAG: class II glutamine amidotransferase [Clostridia bacterium]|nr:class II glutamine amidotransferase [Clostridia bacterium]
MCGIFGVLDYKGKLKDMDELVHSIAYESAERGTDATGVAYVSHGGIKVKKDAVSAYNFKTDIPKGTRAVIGHTRHSTQGDKKKNYNNHPWSETVSNGSFALAHNGVLMNDSEIQKRYNFKSKIETDSFVAVQLIKYKNKLDFDSLKFMAEEIRGSFSFNLLDNKGNIYIVKGDSPIALIHFRKQGVYAFASTERILWRGLIDSELFDDLQAGNFEYINIREGEILRLNAHGRIDRKEFEFYDGYGLDWRMGYSAKSYYGDDFDYKHELRNVAPYFGYDREEVDEMLSMGYTPEEIEELLYGYIPSEV